jgi:hypothetical protein
MITINIQNLPVKFGRLLQLPGTMTGEGIIKYRVAIKGHSVSGRVNIDLFKIYNVVAKFHL